MKTFGLSSERPSVGSDGAESQLYRYEAPNVEVAG